MHLKSWSKIIKPPDFEVIIVIFSKTVTIITSQNGYLNKTKLIMGTKYLIQSRINKL